MNKPISKCCGAKMAWIDEFLCCMSCGELAPQTTTDIKKPEPKQVEGLEAANISKPSELEAIRGKEGWRERFEIWLDENDFNIGNSYGKFEKFMDAELEAKDKEIVLLLGSRDRAYERGKGDGIREEAIGCYKHCEQAREEGHDEGFDHGYGAGYAEGLDLRKEYNDPALIKEIEEKARQEARDDLLKELSLTHAWHFRDTTEIERAERAITLEEVKREMRTGAGLYYDELARQPVMSLFAIIELIERLQKDGK